MNDIPKLQYYSDDSLQNGISGKLTFAFSFGNIKYYDIDRTKVDVHLGPVYWKVIYAFGKGEDELATDAVL